MTVRELIKGSLRLIGAISSGETPSAAEEADALSSLNDLLESWSAEGFLVHQIVREVFPLVASQQAYTIGVGGNFNTARPMQIVEAGIIENGSEIPLEIITVQAWSEISIKTTTSNIPQKLYPQGSFPLEILSLWPVPSIANSLVTYSVKPLTAFAAVADNVSFPPGYARALRYNLALDMSPEYGRDPSAMIAMVAADTKADLKRKNIQPQMMSSDVSGMSGHNSFNIYTGE